MKLFDVYSLYDIEPVRGKGNYVYTADGTPYLDFYGGHAVLKTPCSNASPTFSVRFPVMTIISSFLPIQARKPTRTP